MSSSKRTPFELSIVTTCSWLQANYDYSHSSIVSREGIWSYFSSEHKHKGLHVEYAQYGEFTSYLLDFVGRCPRYRHIIVDKERRELVNLRRKRSGPPEKCSKLDILIRYWLVTAFEETAPDREMHTNLFFTEFCSTFGLDSSDKAVKDKIYTSIICNIGDLIENGAFTKVNTYRRAVRGLTKRMQSSAKLYDAHLQCSSRGEFTVEWKVPYDEMSADLSMTRPAGRILYPPVPSTSKKTVKDSSSTSASSRVNKGSTKDSVQATIDYLTNYQHQQDPRYRHKPEQSSTTSLLPPTRQAKHFKTEPVIDHEVQASTSTTPVVDYGNVSGSDSELLYNSHSLFSVLRQCKHDIQDEPNTNQPINPQTNHWEFCTPLPEFLSLFTKGTPATARLVITDVMRFIPDWSFDPDVCGPINESCPEAFDVVVFDGCGFIKIVLHTSCNFLVQKHLLYPGCFVEVNELAMACKGNQPFVVAGDVDVLETSLTMQQLDFIGKVREKPEYKKIVRKPALTYREYYVSLWTNEDPPEPGYWNLLCTGRVVKSCNMDLLSNIAKILEKFDSQHGSETLHRSIAGRILSKSRMIHFAKVVSSMTTSFPFQFYVEIADATANIILVFWGLNALQWFDKIEVGDVIAAEGFTVRKVNPNLSQNWRRSSHRGRGVQELEFSLSYSSPLKKIVSAREIEDLHLPQVAYSFISHADLNKSPDDMIFDVFGIMVYTGRVERIKKKPKKAVVSTETQAPDVSACTYWQYRWIGLVDGSSSRPYFLKLFSCCKQEFHTLQPGQFLVCTNAVVKSDAINSRTSRNVYVTSTVESQYYILSGTTPFGGTTVEREPLLLRTMSISQMKEMEPILLASVVGGYMLMPHDFQKLYNDDDDDESKKLTKGEELTKICDALGYLEYRHVVIKAEVIRVEFVAALQDLGSDPNTPEGNYVVENQSMNDKCADIEFIGMEYLDPSVLWQPFTANVENPADILPNHGGYWILTLLTQDEKAVVNVTHMLINKECWLFPHLKERSTSPFEKLLEMPVFDAETLKQRLELVSQNLFDRLMSFSLRLYSLGGDNIEIVIEGVELL